MMSADIARFWSKVEKADGCWLWRAGQFSGGYGQFWVTSRRRRVRAHRFAYEISHNLQPPEGLVVMHICDNPTCVRPDHLVLGTSAANTADRVRKGRSASGDRSATRKYPGLTAGVRNGRCKLTEDQVLAIRREASAATRTELGRRYGVSRPVVSAIISRRAWGHVW